MSNDLTAQQHQQLGRLVAQFPIADELGRRFADAGYELYLVGGIVRDTLLGRATAEADNHARPDLDFATPALPEATEAILRGWADDLWLTGARFGTVSARKADWHLEITTFRSDAYTPGSRHPE